MAVNAWESRSNRQQRKPRSMSEEKTKNDTKGSGGATFDMYHFFSRKDVILAAIVIIVLLLYALFQFFTGSQAV